ncbi:AcrB/AcrD/AcrF family protein [Candidatus Fermentibacteria bacterium]|nr:MAG: AcrB/AcrD/AcrF family protein [Candidatus Fermentibacteria bacterium]
MSLSSLSVRRRITFMMVFIFIIGVGFFGLSKLGIDLFPKLEFPMVIVTSNMQGAGPEEMENLVTKYLEEAVSRVENVKEVNSISSNGSSVIMAEFQWGHSLETAETDIRRQLDLYGSALPEDCSDPMVIALDPSMQPILFIGLSSPVLDDFALRRLIETEIEPRLARQEGVGSVTVAGGLVREIQVEVDPARLESSGLSISQVVGALARVRNDKPAGTLESGGEQINIRVEASVTSLADMEQLVVGNNQNGPVLLRDVADVIDGEADVNELIRMNQTPSLFVYIQRRSDANTVNVCREVTAELDRIAEEYRGQVVPYVMYDQSTFITKSIGNLASTAVTATILAFLVLLFFLRSPRGAAIAGSAIPISIVVTFAAMHFFDVDLNMISLAGLALAVGMLVDNSIVVLENIYRHRGMKDSAIDSAVSGSQEVGMAITASTLTTLAVFVPILFVPGIAGQMFREMVLTIVFSLVVSLFVALSLVPLLSSFAKNLVPLHKKGSVSARIKTWFENLERRYSVVASKLVQKKKRTLIVTAIAFLASLALIPVIKTEFLPDNDDGMIQINLEAAIGTDLETTSAMAEALEDSISAIFEEGDLITLYSKVGAAGGMGSIFGGDKGSYSVDMMLRLVPVTQRSIGQQEYEERIRELLDRTAGFEYDISGGNFMGGSAIEVKVFGDNLDILSSESERMREAISSIEGVREPKTTMENMIPELTFRQNYTMLALQGMHPANIAGEISNAFGNSPATIFREDGEEYNVIVQYPEAVRDSREELDYLSVFGSPAANFGYFEERLISTSIRRTNQQRCVTITCDVSGRSLDDVAADVQRVVEENNDYNLRIEFGGEMKDQKETFLYLGIAIVVAALLVYMVMASQFESLLEPFIIIFTVPMAIIGVLVGLFITGTPLSVMSLIGVLMLAGIVVNNGIVMVDYANQILHKKKTSLDKAIVEAATTRLRPILMTALTTMLAMTPLALGIGEGAETWAPMAITVIFGLLAATTLTLLVEPCVYVVMGKRIASKMYINPED